jgi:hypothetical protein
MEDRPPDPVSPPDSWNPSPPPPIEPPAAAVIPWEEPGRPWLSGMTETLRLLFTQPRAAFDRMPITGDVMRPFLFAIAIGWVGILFSILWNALFQGLMPHGGDYARYGMPAFWMPVFAVGAPLFIVVGTLIGTAIDHLFLMLVGGAKRGLPATLRVLCYAQAPQIFNVLPGCGSMLAAIGCLVLTVIGLSSAHRISTGKSALAVLLPSILCCACIAILGVTVGASLLARLGMHR